VAQDFLEGLAHGRDVEVKWAFFRRGVPVGFTCFGCHRPDPVSIFFLSAGYTHPHQLCQNHAGDGCEKLLHSSLREPCVLKNRNRDIRLAIGNRPTGARRLSP